MEKYKGYELCVTGRVTINKMGSPIYTQPDMASAKAFVDGITACDSTAPRTLSDYPPPHGEQWQNPAGLTPEQVEVEKGWRLALITYAQFCAAQDNPPKQ